MLVNCYLPSQTLCLIMSVLILGHECQPFLLQLFYQIIRSRYFLKRYITSSN
uniref:Uncharacterized protein n=1 Tax=Arundo donax TaxID=35708 RepID=A0A0A9D377_ARUDO